jgi:hypothetical protein
MKELTNIYKEIGQQFVDDLFKDYLLVTEKLSGSSFSFERHGDEIRFFKGSNKRPINLVDRTLMMYYEQAIQYILNKTENHIKDLPEYWRFCFQYFVNNQPGAIEYDNVPMNNLVLTHIQVKNPKGKIAKVIEDPRVLRDWASAFDVTPLIPIFSGYLKEDQKRKIREFLSTPKEDQLELFGTNSFAKYLIESLNPTITRTTLQNDLNKPIDSIIFKFFKQGTNQTFTAKMIDPYTQALMKDKEPVDLKRAPADINEILLLDILAFVEQRGLRAGELLTSNPQERYLELMANLFNDYVAKRGSDLKKLDIEKASFAKGPEFDVNLNLIKNNQTRELLQDSESLRNLYKIVLGSLRKKRNPKRVGSIMTASVVEDFNKLVDLISATINKETDGEFKTFGDYLNTKVSESYEEKDLEEMLVEEKVLNYNNFIHLGKVNINEAKKIGKGDIEKFWIKAYKQYTTKMKMITDFVKVSNRKGHTGEVLRANFGPNDGTAKDAIDKFIVSNVVGLKKRSFNIEELPIGYLSSDYAAYKIVIQNATDNKLRQAYGVSDFFIITNRYKISKKTGEAALVGKKDLTPAKLGMGSTNYTNWASLISPVEQFMNNSRYPENYKNFMIEAAKEISSNSKNAKKFKDFTEYANAPIHTITYPITKSLFDGIDQLSLQNIRNDYGEVLGGFMLLNIIQNPGDGVSYPPGEAEPMVDFYFDTYSISSKGGKKGGTPTGDTIIQRIYAMANDTSRVPGPLSFDTAGEQDFYNNVINTWVNPTRLARSQIYGRIMSLCSANLNDHSKSAYWYLLKEAELQPDNATQESVEKFLNNLYTDKDAFTNFLRTFWEKSTYKWNEAKLQTNVDGFGEFIGNHKLGVVFYPLMVEITGELNKKYNKELTKYAQIVTDVKQMYLDVKAKNGIFEFKTVPFSTANFEFEQKASIPTPFNANMGIAIVK